LIRVFCGKPPCDVLCKNNRPEEKVLPCERVQKPPARIVDNAKHCYAYRVVILQKRFENLLMVEDTNKHLRISQYRKREAAGSAMQHAKDGG
jgi:hypothetical protein